MYGLLQYIYKCKLSYSGFGLVAVPSLFHPVFMFSFPGCINMCMHEWKGLDLKLDVGRTVDTPMQQCVHW